LKISTNYHITSHSLFKPNLPSYFHSSLPLTLQPNIQNPKNQKQFIRTTMADLHIQNQQQSSMADHHIHTHTHKTHNTSVKRRSRPSSSSDQRSSKKHSFDQEKLARNGFSAITLPISLCGNVLRGSVSDPSYTLQEQTMPVKGSSGLPPRPPISRCNSEVIDPATVKAAVSSCLKSEENSPPPDSKVCMEVVFLDEKVIFF
jgi:hypothetical protein